MDHDPSITDNSSEIKINLSSLDHSLFITKTVTIMTYYVVYTNLPVALFIILVHNTIISGVLK